MWIAPFQSRNVNPGTGRQPEVGLVGSFLSFPPEFVY